MVTTDDIQKEMEEGGALSSDIVPPYSMLLGPTSFRGLQDQDLEY